MTTSQMSQLPLTVITKLLSDDSDLVVTDIARLIKGIAYVIKTYYGMDPDTGRYDDVIEMTVNKIKIKFPSLTFLQFNECYFSADIEKRPGAALTVTELVTPLSDFVHKTNYIKAKAQEFLSQKNEAIEHQEKVKDAYLRAKQLYFDSMGNGEYLGDLFDASMIIENFKDLLDNSTKLELLNEAKQDYAHAVYEYNNSADRNQMVPVPRGTGKYENGMDKPECHYFLAMRIINHFLRLKTVDGKGWKFVEK